MANLTARMAYRVTRHNGVTGYLARLRVYSDITKDKPFPCNVCLGIGDTREEAEGDAIRYMRDLLNREGLAMPEVVSVGKVTAFAFDQPYFV